MLEIIIAIFLNFIASYISYRKSSLSFNGYIAAFLLGSLIYIFGGFFSCFLKQSEKGSSGSVSMLGLTASIFGASFIAVLYCFNYLLEYHFKSLPLINIILIIFSGFLGSLLDSILGTLLQANYSNCIIKSMR